MAVSSIQSKEQSKFWMRDERLTREPCKAQVILFQSFRGSVLSACEKTLCTVLTSNLSCGFDLYIVFCRANFHYYENLVTSFVRWMINEAHEWLTYDNFWSFQRCELDSCEERQKHWNKDVVFKLEPATICVVAISGCMERQESCEQKMS